MEDIPPEDSVAFMRDDVVTVAVVIVNYRTSRLVVECLQSLAIDGYTPVHGRVVVVDNDSQDGSADAIRAAIIANGWAWVELVAAGRNGGFSFGNNVGIRRLLSLPEREQPPLILLLNPDTVVRNGAIEALVQFMEGHPEVGIAGSRLVNPDDSVRRTAFRFHSIMTEFAGRLNVGILTRQLPGWAVAPTPPEQPSCVDWVSGASFCVRREVFSSVGLLDEGYFLYYEETDFCLHAKRHGWPTWYVPQSRVVHLVGQSTGVTRQDITDRRRPAYWFASRARYFRKNYGIAYLVTANIAWLAGSVLARVRQMLARRPNRDPYRLHRDFILYSFAAE